MSSRNEGIFRHIFNALFWSAAGIKAAWTHELAFRAQVIVIIAITPVGIWLGETPIQWALLFGSCMWVLAIELLNTALEAIVDRIGLEHNELSGRAKDLGSAASFFTMAAAVVIWALVAYNRFWG